jgi:hypothetical protein
MSISPPEPPPRKRRAYRRRKRSNVKVRRDSAVLITIPASTHITGWGINMSYRKAREGKLPGAVMIDGRWYVNKPILLAWLATLGAAQSAA